MNKANCYGKDTVTQEPVFWLLLSYSSRAFLVVLGRRNGHETICTALYPHTFHISFTRVFPSGFLSPPLLSGTGVSTIHSVPSLYHFSLFSVIFFVTGSTFTDPRASSLLSLSFFVTRHIHLTILISFTSILLAWLFVGDHQRMECFLRKGTCRHGRAGVG